MTIIQKSTILFKTFEPDKSDYNPQISDNIRNVQPRADGWGSLKGFDVVGAGLGTEPRGGLTVSLEDGSFDIYLGDADTLYKFDAGTESFNSISTGFTLQEGQDWSMIQYGKYLFACNGIDNNQYIDVEAGVSFGDVTGSPKANFVGATGDFLVFLGLVSNPRALQWSGLAKPFHWTVKEQLSDYQEIPDGGNIKGFVGYDTGGVILLADKLATMERNDRSSIFTIRTKQKSIGCFSPNSIIPVGNDFYYYSQSGFLKGVDAEDIGAEKVNDFVVNNANVDFRKAMRGCYDPITKMIWWIIEKDDASRFMLGYSVILRQWVRADMDIDYIFSAVAPSSVIDGLDALGVIDGIDITIDSLYWQGNTVRVLAGVQTDGSFGYFLTSTLPATLETSDMFLNGDGAVFVQGLKLVGDDIGTNYTVQIGIRNHAGGDITWSSEFTPSGNEGFTTIRKRTGPFRIRINVAAGIEWTKISGFILHWRPAGKNP